jgi:tetratricopeptide (TPR) repeat protein
MLLLLFAFVTPVRAQSSSTQRPPGPQSGTRTPSAQTKLKQYLVDLQNNPDDRELREKIIKLVQTMKPAPALPQEAQDELAKGNDLAKQASQQEALAHYERAALLAPWWPDAYYNLANLQEKLEKFDEASASLSPKEKVTNWKTPDAALNSAYSPHRARRMQQRFTTALRD